MTVSPEIEELIADAPLSAHFATSVGDRPHVAPVWYGYENGTVSVLTGGKKLENCRRNPRVAVSIEKRSANGVEWMVALQGTATVVEDPERMRAARERIFPKYENREPDGGEDDTSETAADDDAGENDANGDEPTGALIEVTIGSATAQRY